MLASETSTKPGCLCWNESAIRAELEDAHTAPVAGSAGSSGNSVQSREDDNLGQLKLCQGLKCPKGTFLAFGIDRTWCDCLDLPPSGPSQRDEEAHAHTIVSEPVSQSLELDARQDAAWFSGKFSSYHVPICMLTSLSRTLCESVPSRVRAWIRLRTRVCLHLGGRYLDEDKPSRKAGRERHSGW